MANTGGEPAIPRQPGTEARSTAGWPGTVPAQGEPPMGLVPDTVLEALCDELLARGRRVWRRVASDSMAPLLLAGDRILVEPCTADQVRWGDVIVFRSAAGPMVHRVLGARGGASPRLIEKGDANPFAGIVGAAMVAGRVCRRERHGKSVDLLHGRGRAVQILLATLSLIELVGLLAGRGLRRALRIERHTGIATRVASLVHRASARIARLLGLD